MPGTAPDSPPPRPDVAAKYIPDLDACWPRVQVASAEIAPSGGTHCARAVIQLGGLTPADVRVELVPDEPQVVDKAPAEERRMFSSYAYDNGCFVFEASLARHEAARARDWLIHVHPPEAVDEPRVTYRFRTSA